MQPIDGARRHDRVAVEEQEVRAAAGPDAAIGPAREAEVVAGLDDSNPWPSSRGVGAAIRRRVVHDDDFVAVRGRRVVQRLQAPLEIGPGVERHDDDGDVHGRAHIRAECSIAASVSRPARGQLYLASASGAAASSRARVALSNRICSSACEIDLRSVCAT